MRSGHGGLVWFLAFPVFMAAFATRAADVALTEDLVITNVFVNPNADKPMPAQRTVTGFIGLNESPVVIENADFQKIIPVYAKGYNNINNATMHFYHRRVDEGAGYVLYQAQCISGGLLRCVFVKFEQDGDDVKVTSPYQTSTSTEKGFGCKFSESGANSSYEIQDLTCLVMTDETYSYGESYASLPKGLVLIVR